jgi:mRNA interferase RelE/StbE
MNSAIPWAVHVDSAVRKQLRRVPAKDALRLVAAIADFAANPYAGDVVKMQGEEDVWRRRVGAYRIFYEVHPKEREVYVFRVTRRTSTAY